MQLSIKTPSELTLPLLEKCAVLGEKTPSHFVTEGTWQCLKWMDMPYAPFHPLHLVQKYYHALGREHEFLLPPKKKQDAVIERLAEQNRKQRASAAAARLRELKSSLKKHPTSKHLHLKISQGMNKLPQRIKAKAEWLRITPNALVIACLRGCLEAMDDPMKAFAPPPIVVEFWTISHAKLHPNPADALEAMTLESYAEALRARSGPLVDTIIRLALCERWDATLKEILSDADAEFSDELLKD